MIIRPATPNDLQGILDIYNDAVLHSTATAEYNPHTLAMRQAWYEEHTKLGLPVLVAEAEDGAVAGWSSLSQYHSRYGYRFTVEDSVYIAEPYRGKGLGKQLVVPLIERARELKLHAIIASIDSANDASLRLHKSLGFVQGGYLKEIIYKFDQWLDCVYLQLMLE